MAAGSDSTVPDSELPAVTSQVRSPDSPLRRNPGILIRLCWARIRLSGAPGYIISRGILGLSLLAG